MKKLIILLVPILLLCGCNKQIIDLDYSYDKVVCNYNGTNFELKIDKWKDYEGEQLQVKSNGKTYLLSANNCYLIGE
jgi:hypothetical protein